MICVIPKRRYQHHQEARQREGTNFVRTALILTSRVVGRVIWLLKVSTIYPRIFFVVIYTVLPLMSYKI